MFKSNSRFSDNKPKYDDRPKYNTNIFSKKVSDKTLEKEKEAKEIKIAKALAIENFPELVSLEKKITFVQNSSFLEKTKPKQIKNIENNVEEKVIPYGWVKISRNQTTNRLVLKYNKEYEEEEKRKKDEEENKKQFYSYKVINALNNLHFKRTQEYIDNWGYDEYEKMFLDINHDSEYFDKLDAKYEEEMEKIRELELEQEIKQENDDL